MLFKNFKKSFFLLLLLFIIPINVLAYSDRIIAGGENIGITLNSDGILIVGTYEVNGTSPAKEAGLKTGDVIQKINNNSVSTIEDMATEINKVKDEKITVTYSRNNKEKNTTLNLYKDENDIYKSLKSVSSSSSCDVVQLDIKDNIATIYASNNVKYEFNLETLTFKAVAYWE